METRASYVLVGAFVLALFGGAFAFVLFMTQTGYDDDTSPYVIFFKGSVTGLQIGGAVRYRGVPVGTVTDIRIDPANIEQVRVETEIASGTPIKVDTVASLGLQGITGLSYIQLTGGSKEADFLKPAKDNKLPVIKAEPSGIEQVLERIPEVLENAVKISEQLAKLLDEKNVQSVGETIENLRSMSATLSGGGNDIQAALTDGREAFAALRDASESVAKLTADLQKRAGPITASAEGAMNDFQVTMSDARKTVADFSRVANELSKLVEENRVPIRDFSTNGLYELSQFIAEARVLVASLSRLTNQIERDPARFFFGDTQKGFEPQ